MATGDDGIPELTEAEKIRLQATHSDFAAMSAALRSGTATPDDVQGAFGRLKSLGIDPDTWRNALHIPADAGPSTAAIEAILRRIPEGWGRWIGTDAGWYPLLIVTDWRLAQIDADYVVHQVKEKFGTLRYYCAPRSDEPGSEVWEAFHAIVDDAERASATMCERCGAPAILQRARNWMKTLCTTCAGPLGYSPA